MSDIHKNPQDIIDLSVQVSFDDGDISTLGVRAYVYDPDGNAVSGSPFALSHVANGLYQKKSAFQADVESGTYDVTYIFYTDDTYATEHDNNGRVHDTITISIQSTTGLGGNGAVEYDDTNLIKEIKKLSKNIKYFDDRIKKIENQEIIFDIKPILDEINKLPKSFEYNNDDIKDILNKSDKGVVKLIDMLNSSSGVLKDISKVSNNITSEFKKQNKIFNEIDDRQRQRIKFLLDRLITLMSANKSKKQEILIDLLKEEE